MPTTYVQLSQRIYECQECGITNAYGDDDFDLHRASGIGEKWIYLEIKANQ